MKVTGTLAFLAVLANPLWAQCDLEKVLPTDLAPDDQVNTAAFSGERMLVGAWRSDHSGIDSGAAYVFLMNSDGSWGQEQELVGSDVGPDGWFGKYVALDGDTAVVGCPEELAAGDPPGEAYVFRFNGSTWVEEQILRQATPDPDSRFGAGVEIDGDTIIVAANKAFGSGRAYIYHREGNVWVEQAVLQSPDPTPNDSFASEVDVSGDLAVVGSRYDGELGSLAGAAFVFRREGSTWVLEQKLLASDGAPGDRLGSTAAIDGTRLIAGASFADTTGIDAGGVYAFERIDGVWVETGKLVGSDTLPGDHLGYWVDIYGSRAMAGARDADDLGDSSGEAYLFEYGDGQWSERRKYLAPDGAAGDYFGSVALDDRRTAICAYGDDNAAGVNAGAAYVAPLPTTARFSSSRTLGVRSLTVSFQDLSLGNVTSYLWDFGDGFLSTLQNPIYTYNMPGTYTVMLTVDGPCGMSSETKVDYIQVLPRPRLPWFGPPPRDLGNAPPVANAGPDQTVNDVAPLGSEQVTLDGTASSDPEGMPLSGVWRENGNPIASGLNPTVALAQGVHTITLTVTDVGGATDADDVLIRVNGPPVADPGSDQVLSDYDGNGQELAMLDGSNSYDPDGTIVSYVWRDGAGQVVSTNPSFELDLSVGEYVFTLTVTDDDGATDSAPVVVTVNQAPTADAGPDQVIPDADGDGAEGVMLDGTGSSDPDGFIVYYVWMEGGNQIGSGPNPLVNLTVGIHTIVLTVIDDRGATGADQVMVSILAN